MDMVQSYLADVLHAVSQALLAPDIILLLAFIAYALFCVGSIVAERFSERRHFRVVMPKFLASLMAAKEDEIPQVIIDSGLLHRQKVALLTVFDYRMLPGDALVALIRRLVSEEETRYDRITGRNNMAARVAPMLGLMGTLIPLGPGIQALGRSDTAALSNSLLVAFDTTVAGLVAAAVCLVIGKIRSNWYGNYMSALDSGMATMLQKIEDMRAEGKIVIQEPTDYAFLYEENGPKRPSKEARDAAAAAQAEQLRAREGQGSAAQPQQSAGTGAPTYAAPNTASSSNGGVSSANAAQAQSFGASATGPIFATPPSQGMGATGPMAMPGQVAGESGPTFGSRPEAASSAAGPVLFDSRSIPSIEPPRVGPAIQEVPMPAFIDALAQAGVSDNASDRTAQAGMSSAALNASLPDPLSVAAASGWRKPLPQDAVPPSNGAWPQPSQTGQPDRAGQAGQAGQPS